MTFLVAKVDNNWLWNKRFNHINSDNIVKWITTLDVRDLPKIVKPTNMVCKERAMEKKKKRKNFTISTKLEIVHTDLSGPTKTRAYYGERYFMIIVDDFTRMMWVAFLREKSKSFDEFKVFRT